MANEIVTHRKLHSDVSPHAGGQLNYNLPYSKLFELAYHSGQNWHASLAGKRRGLHSLAVRGSIFLYELVSSKGVLCGLTRVGECLKQ